MKKYLQDYVNKIDRIIKSKKVTNVILDEHLIKIQFFQHERLIHLLVTLFYAIFLISMIALTIYYKLLSIVVIILTIFLIFYVKHYFFLENYVQYLYKQYDKMLEIKK